MKTNLELKMSFTFLILVLTLNIGFVSASGFASTYIPDIDGKDVIVMNASETESFFIYLQNQGTSTETTKVEVLDVSKLIQNNLSEYYEVPKDTLSSDFPIEFKIILPSNAIQGNVYEIKYYVSYASKAESSIVSFSKASYDKVFYVSYGIPNWETLENNTEALSYENLKSSQSKITGWVENLFSNEGLEVGSKSEILKRKILRNSLRGLIIFIPLIIIGLGIRYAVKRKTKKQKKEDTQISEY